MKLEPDHIEQGGNKNKEGGKGGQLGKGRALALSHLTLTRSKHPFCWLARGEFC